MGTLCHLKNFRKGLRHQFGQAGRALAEAAQDGKSPDVLQQLQRRIEWVETKYSQLVKGRMILRDAPGCVDGVWQKWGGRGGDAEREMTAQEMQWNQRLSAEKEETEWREERARQIAEGAEAVRRARQQRTQLSEPMWVNPPTWCGPPADHTQDVQEGTAAGGKDLQLQEPSSPGGRAATASAAQEDVQLQQPRSQQAALSGKRPLSGIPAKRMPRPKVPPASPTPAWQGASSCRRGRGETPPPRLAAEAPPPWRQQERLLEGTEAERDRLPRDPRLRLSASQRASTAYSRAETTEHRHQRSKENVVLQERDARAPFEENRPRRNTPGVGTHAAMDDIRRMRWSRLPPDQAADAERTRPYHVFSTPHQATSPFHEDWTEVPGSSNNAEKWEQTLLLRHKRNQMIQTLLKKGEPVSYTSSGNSMWPLVQSGDDCHFLPVQAVPPGIPHTISKSESKIQVGDVVFCVVQRSHQYIAHIVLRIEHYRQEGPKYWIGRMDQKVNGWCHRKHLFGILVRVEAPDPNSPLGPWLERPLPRTVYRQVLGHMSEGRAGWGEAQALTRTATAD